MWFISVKETYVVIFVSINLFQTQILYYPIIKQSRAKDHQDYVDKDMLAPNIIIVKTKEEVLGNLNIGIIIGVLINCEIFTVNYSFRSTPCPNVKHGEEWGEPGNCDAGDLCSYCHTRTEQQFHPEIYKSTKCNDVQQSGYCPRGVFCAFAHVERKYILILLK